MPSALALLKSYTRRDVLLMGALFLAYIGASFIGRFLFTAPAVIQPSAGVALTGLVLGGIHLWPALLAAGLAFGFTSDAPILIIVSATLGHVMHAVVGAQILRRFNFDPVFRRVYDTLLFMFVALFASMIVPTVGMAGIFLNNFFFDPDWPYRATWLSWWSGIMIGDLVLATAAVRYFAKRHFTRTPQEIGELILAFASLAVLSYAVSWTDLSRDTNGIVLLLYLLPFIWFSLRLGNRFTFIAFAMTTVIDLLGVLYGHQTTTQAAGARIIASELFLATLAVIFFLFTAVVEERKRANKALQAQLDRVHSLLDDAKRADRAKSDFIAVFAHELRNPLAPIVSSIELLKFKWGDDEELSSIVKIVDDRTRTIVRLLDDLLDISRIGEGKLRLKKEHVDLGSIVRRAADSIEGHVRNRHQTLSLSVPEERLMLDVDPVRIEQIASNLLNNASKFTHNGGRIALSVRRAGENAEISVTDDGVGIESAMLPRIFEPFLQIETNHRVNEGLGIGLSLTQKLVEVHGGTIAARSDGHGKGAQFTVTLPLSPVTATTLVTNVVPMDNSMQKNALRILVVDDNEAAANGLGTLLQHVGNTVDFAYVGADVAVKAREFKPDVIVLDIGLPDMSGYEVAEQLRKGGFLGRIIALTGYGQDDDKKKAQQAGFDHHLTKPVGLKDLQAVLMPQAA